MNALLLHDGLYFLLTLVLSTMFAMGGVGAAVALVPSYGMLGMALDLAKAIGLFVNSVSTLSASVMNAVRGNLDFRFALPLAAAMMVATPLGAWMSRDVPQHVVQWVLAAFMIVSALLLVFSKRQPRATYDRAWVLLALGAGVGFLSGLIGVGGGSPVLAVLVLLGFDAKKAAYAVSFAIPFSTLGGFFAYLSFTHMDWPLLAVVSVAAVLGGFIGGRIMTYRLSAGVVKQLIAVLLLLLAGKMIWQLLR
ncbi:MAG: sulfite exporter TauE/SafE family protein [Thiomonas sp.]|jgi:uncharacterized membrane protein YfcA